MKIIIWGIYLVIFCLPLYLARFKIFDIPTTVLELMIYGLFIVWGIKYLLGSDTNLRMHANLRIKKVIAPIILIVVGVTLATIFSGDLRTSAGIWKSWFVDPLLFFIVLIAAVKNFKQIKGIFYSLIFSGLVVSIISLIYLIQGKLDPMGRLQGFYNSPNYLAMYLAPILILGFGLWIMAKKHLGKILLFTVVCLLLSVILFFTKSFGAWLGIIGAILFGLAIYLYKLGNKKLVLGVLVLGLVFILLLGYFKLHQSGTDQSLRARLIIWQKGLEVFKANPVLGIGPGTFGNYFPPHPEWGVPQPHSLFLAFLLQTGILGFIGFIWLLFHFFRVGFKLLTAYYSLLTICLMMVMVYILVHGLVDTTYWKNDLSVIFWTIISLMVILSRRSSSTRSGSRIPDYVGASGEK